MHTDPEIKLLPHQYELTTVVSAATGSVAAVLNSGAFVVLDTLLTPELEAEGYARDVVRVVQDKRKAEDLHISDRIRLELRVPDDKVGAVEANLAMIKEETLSLEAKVQGGSADIEVQVEKIG